MRNKKITDGAYVTCGNKKMKVNLSIECPDGKICCEWVDNDPESENYGNLSYDFYEESELEHIEYSN